MKNLLFFLIAYCLSTSVFSEGKRTDGPPGSEYGNVDLFKGDVSVGAHFGALVSTRTSNKSSFALGLDVDYRPYDLFGIRFNFFQGIQNPQSSLLSFTPLLHAEFSNLKPYVLGGAGIGIIESNNTFETKFLIPVGLGGDVVLTNHIGFGLEWVYHGIFDIADVHAITARASYKF